MSVNTVDGSVKNQKMEHVLLELIKTLEDSQKGFADIGDRLKDHFAQTLFSGGEPEAREFSRRA